MSIGSLCSPSEYVDVTFSLTDDSYAEEEILESAHVKYSATQPRASTPRDQMLGTSTSGEGDDNDDRPNEDELNIRAGPPRVRNYKTESKPC